MRVHCSFEGFAGEGIRDVERIDVVRLWWLRCGKAACLIRTNHFAAVQVLPSRNHTTGSQNYERTF
jgi:hypothetical protein